MNEKEKIFCSFIITLILMGVSVGATVVGPDGTYDADYTNATIGNFQNIFLSGVNYTANLIAGGGSGWDGTGALFQNATRELTANWDVGAYNITADNFTAQDFYLESIGNLTAYIDSEISGVSGGTAGAIAQTPYDYLVYESGGNYYLENSTGGNADSSADADDVFTWADGNITTAGTIWVMGGEFALDSFQATKTLIIQGNGMDSTIFNLTNNNWSIDSNGDMTWKDLQFVSHVDGNSHYIIDASVEFERVYFNIMAHTNAEAGMFKFRGGADDYAEFRQCKWNFGDGLGTSNYFFWWTTSMDHLYIDDMTVEMANATSHIILFSTGAGTWVETVRMTDIEVYDWYAANVGTDSGIFYRNGYQVGTLIIDGYKFRVPSTDFGGDNQQLNVNGPCAGTTLITNVVMDYRSHFYAGFNDSMLSNSVLEGESTAATRTAFDFGVQGTYPKFGTAINNILNNASITFNSGYKIAKSIGNTYKGSRLTIMNENDAVDGPKHVISDGDSFYLNDADGTDLWKDWIQITQSNTQQIKTIQISDAYFEGGRSVIEALNAAQFTESLNVTISNLVMNSSSSVNFPELINTGGNSRDGNVTIAIYDSTLYSVIPPLDDWNPMLVGDSFDNVLWIDASDGAVYRSNVMGNFTISQNTSFETVTHGLPARGPLSFIIVMPTSDLANCSIYWVPYADFNHTQFSTYVGDNTGETDTDANITYLFWGRTNP